MGQSGVGNAQSHNGTLKRSFSKNTLFWIIPIKYYTECSVKMKYEALAIKIIYPLYIFILLHDNSDKKTTSTVSICAFHKHIKTFQVNKNEAD